MGLERTAGRLFAGGRRSRARRRRGCGGGDDDGDGGQRGAATSGKPLKIGASLPLTGEFSEPGKAAQQGYKVWEAMINEKGGLLGRKVQIVIKDDASNQNTVVADYNALISQDKVDLLLGTFSSLLNLPASAVAERNRRCSTSSRPAASPTSSAAASSTSSSPSRRRPTTRATSGRTGIAALPADQRPEDGGLPDARRPVRDARRRRASRRSSRRRASRPSTARPTRPTTTNFDSIANAIKAQEPRPRRRRHAVRGRRRPRSARCCKAGYTPKWLYQTNAPSFGDQYAKGDRRRRTPRACSTRSATARRPRRPATRSSSPSTRRCSAATEVPEDAADAYAAAEVLQAAVEANKTVGRRTTSSSSPTGCARTGRHDPRPAELERGRQPEGRVPRRPVAERQARDRAAARTPRPRTRIDYARGGRPGGGATVRRRPAGDDRVRSDPHPRPPRRGRLRAARVGPDADLRRHARDQHRARRVPDPGRVPDLLDWVVDRARPAAWRSSSRRRRCSRSAGCST